MRSCDRPPWYLSLSMSLIMRMSMRCCGIWPDPQRARGYAQRVGSYATSAPNGVSVRPPSTSRRRGLGHVTEMTGRVPETVGHDAENTGHALPKYAPADSGTGTGSSTKSGARPPGFVAPSRLSPWPEVGTTWPGVAALGPAVACSPATNLHDPDSLLPPMPTRPRGFCIGLRYDQTSCQMPRHQMAAARPAKTYTLA